MTGFKKFLLWAGGLILLIVLIVGIFVGRDIFEMERGFAMWDKQMDTGRKYMDSLTDKDIQVWEERTEKYLKEDSPANFTIDAKPVPPDLKQLGIFRIDEGPNVVEYDWMGGMDHTELDVERTSNGIFRFTAVYDDYSNRVIWPRQ